MTATHPDICTDLPRLALMAAAALVSREMVRITHPPTWRRPTCWPTPAAKSQSTTTASGHKTHEYRPITLLIYIEKSTNKPTGTTGKTPKKIKQLEIHA